MKAHSIISVEDRLDDREALLAARKVPGARRKEFDASVANLPESDAVISVRYGRAGAFVNKLGETVDPEKNSAVVSDSSEDDMSEVAVSARATLAKRARWTGLNPSVKPSLAGSAPLNKVVHGIEVPCGVCLILAGGGRGKTPLAHALASHGSESYSTVRVGEPLAGYASDAFEAAEGLASAIMSSKDVVLDSIKDLLSGGGSAMKSGISRDALVSISSWASLACDTGCTIYIPVNPSTPDPEVLELLAEVSRSNATMTIVAAGSDKWAYSSRTGEGLPRQSGSFSVQFSENGFAEIKTSSAKSITSGEFSKYVTTVLSTQAWSQAQRRAISAN